jgi:Family of unknown function (DUF5684)
MEYVVILIYLAVMIAVVVALWKVFTKAGEPGWAVLIPFYNIIVMLKIVGKPAWWIVLFFIPIANFVVAILIALEMAKSFGKTSGFGIGLLLLPIVFYPILGFGDAEYVGPGGAA